MKAYVSARAVREKDIGVYVDRRLSRMPRQRGKGVNEFVGVWRSKQSRYAELCFARASMMLEISTSEQAMARKKSVVEGCRRLKAGCFRSVAGSTSRYPRFHRWLMGDNDGLAKGKISTLGQRCEERDVRFKGEPISSLGWGLVDWPRMKRQYRQGAVCAGASVMAQGRTAKFNRARDKQKENGPSQVTTE
jgi:hypothetical protein